MESPDPRLFEPRYDVVHAALYLRMPESTLRAWVHGQDRFKPVLTLPTRGYLSFVNLTEAFVLHAMRRRYNISLEDIRIAIDYVRRDLNVEHPLAFQEFKTNKVHLFIETALGALNASRRGQISLNEVKIVLERIEWRDKRPIGLFPVINDDWHERRTVRISPLVAFGKPVITGTGIPTGIVAERFHAGESVTELAEDYRLTIEEIEEAVRAETFLKAA